MHDKLLGLLTDYGSPALGSERRPGTKSVADLERAMDSIFGADKDLKSQRDLIRAIVLLWHDHLEESHAISQNIPTADGSFVHGIMHRREPDYGNAKYWFHKVGRHPVFRTLKFAPAILKPPPSKSKALQQLCEAETWDPMAFIDACEEAQSEDGATESFLRSLQAKEMALLFGHVLGDST